MADECRRPDPITLRYISEHGNAMGIGDGIVFKG
jgi:hypothetical protein